MIIYGAKTFNKVKAVSDGQVVCRRCGRSSHFELLHVWRWATLFFIPVCPIWIRKIIVCPHCGFEIKVNKQNELQILNDLENLLNYLNPPPLPSSGQEVLQSTVQKSIETPKINLNSDEVHRLSQVQERIAKYQGCITAGGFVTIGLKTDGTILADGDKKQCRIEGWNQITMVTAGTFHSVGLKLNGNIVTAGGDKQTFDDIDTWRNIVSIATKDNATLGLKADGAVVAVGLDEAGGCKDNDWQNIVAIDTSGKHSVGLMADGTVVAIGKNKNGQCNTGKWTNIVAVAAGTKHTLGLRADGIMEAVGLIKDGMNDIAHWRDIVAISVNDKNIVGLKANGTVVFASDSNLYDLELVTQWQDIVAISSGPRHIVGLKADGTMVAVGKKKDGCNIEHWRDIGPYDRGQRAAF